MQAFDNGALYSVTVTRHEVEAFKASWPCSGLPTAPVTFQFDKRNGDLVDITSSRARPEDFDGPAALALSQDARAYGKKRLKLAD